MQKTKPEEARAILNGQPQIAYALIQLMVKMNAIDVEVMTVR
jgi:cleavage stimulation factor subunit 2